MEASLPKFSMISFIVGKDPKNVDILMSVLVNPETLEVDTIKIAGDELGKEHFSSPIVVDKSLFEGMRNNQLMDLSSKFVGKSKEEIIKAIKTNLQ